LAEIATVVLLLANGEASDLTGLDLPIDGRFTY
jgi:hypothetical protein